VQISKRSSSPCSDASIGLIAIIEDIESGDATIAEAEPIQEEIKKLMRKVRAQMKRAKPKDKAALKSFFGK
jgi:hypothetical protein